MHLPLCVCALVPTLPTRTRVVLIIHRNEARKPTNTGQLALACLPNSEQIVRGIRDGQPPARFVPPPDSLPLFLYPHESATPLATYTAHEKPITLIVPDGNWRQAGKVHARMEGLAEVPYVSIPDDAATAYRLRAETHEHGLATLEAIARALGILEGPTVRAELERVFAVMVERTLKLRGTRFL